MKNPWERIHDIANALGLMLGALGMIILGLQLGNEWVIRLAISSFLFFVLFLSILLYLFFRDYKKYIKV